MRIEKYVSLIIKRGVNLQKNDTLVVSADVKSFEFVQKVVKKAYEEGAKEVIVRYDDEVCARLRGLHASEDVFEVFPKYQAEFIKECCENEYKMLRIISPNPKGMDGVSSNRLMKLQIAAKKPNEAHRLKMMSDQITWSIAAIPCLEWAQIVFKDQENCVELLWDAILDSAHIGAGDPLVSWDNHVQKLHDMCQKLNDYQFKELRYKNSLGTDLVVKLPKGHIWSCGGAFNVNTREIFAPNIPTEEVFTLGDANGVDGVVYSSKPLLYSGQIIDDFSLEFKDGRVIKAHAYQNLSLLEEMIAVDDGASRIGEVALVPFNSPISMSNNLFYCTLFDENASCHLALGEAYPTTISRGDDESFEDLKARGMNTSMIHVDFMIGSSDLSIIGVSEDCEVVVFKDGNFAF